MDRKSIIVLVVCFGALLAWQPLVVNKIWPPKPQTRTNTVAALQPPGTNAPAPVQAAAPDPQAGANALALAPMLPADSKEETIRLETPDAHYIFTSHGGGLKDVELIHYKDAVPKKRGEKASQAWATLNTPARAPAMAILGLTSGENDGVYSLRRTEKGVRAERALTNGLSITKEFTPGSNYLMSVVVRIANGSGQTLTLPPQEWIAGTATPLSREDDGSVVGVMWYNGSKAEDISAGWFANATLGCLPGTPRTEYTGGESNVFWAAPHNQFFAMAMMTKDPAHKLSIRRIDLPPPTIAEASADKRLNKKPYAYESALVFPGIILDPGQSFERKLSVFAGPKEYRTLAAIAAGAKNNVDEVMGFGGFFGFFSKALLLSMNWLHSSMSLSYGLAIIAITIIMKALFWPLTRASTRSMKRMAALQPQMKAIQAKYKEDPVKMNRKTMEFMKEHKVSPLGGCLPMVLQMPVFIGFFYMIRSAIELRGASFLWVADLSRPDTLFLIPGINFPFNLLPLIMGVTMLWQAHLTPPSPGMDPMQQKMMRYMPLMFLFMLYNFSAGLTLYWTVQNLLSIAQMKLTKTTEPVLAAAAAAANVHPPRKWK